MIRNDAGEPIMVRYKGSPWTRGRLRKFAKCVVCGGIMVVGETAFRPIDNSLHRQERMHPACAVRVAR